VLFSATGSFGPPPIYVLDLRTGILQTALRNNQLSTDFARKSWLDGNRLLVGARPVGPGPGYELRILDISNGANQQASDLPLALSSSAECFDADTDGRCSTRASATGRLATWAAACSARRARSAHSHR